LAGSWSLAQAGWAAPQIDPIANKASTILADGLNLLRHREGVSFKLPKACIDEIAKCGMIGCNSGGDKHQLIH
jgi:hypothetical protein